MDKKNFPVKKEKTLPVISDNNLNSYLNFVNNIPMLTLEEEQELAKSYAYKKDVDAAQKIVLAHLRFVTKMARNLSGYGLSASDLIQEGNIGLMKAVTKFDPEQGVRFVSFAVHWVKAEMHDYVLKNWKIVKVATTKSQRKLFFNLRSSKNKSGWLNSEDVKQIAQELNVKENVVIEMEKRMCQGDISLDLPYNSNEEEYSTQQSLYLEDKTSDLESQIVQEDYYDNFKKVVRDIMTTFDDRAKDIVLSRYLLDKKITLQELAAKYSISAERVRQIEEESLAKIKREIKKQS